VVMGLAAELGMAVRRQMMKAVVGEVLDRTVADAVVQSAANSARLAVGTELDVPHELRELALRQCGRLQLAVPIATYGPQPPSPSAPPTTLSCSLIASQI
jgi:hypothetical protein